MTKLTTTIALLAFVIGFGGCAAVTNPVGNGMPVRLVPPALLAETKEGFVDVPLRSLQRPERDNYRLGPGDILSVYVETVLGEKGQLPPINMPDATANLLPSVGYPLPILEDGTVALPLLQPTHVAGMTVKQARDAVRTAYLDGEILKSADQVVLVTLIRPRQVSVLVIREDADGDSAVRQAGTGLRGFSGNTFQVGRPRGSGDVVELPAYQNDVLTALARTGGLPGSDAVAEVIVQRAQGSTVRSADNPLSLGTIPPGVSNAEGVIRIPLRLRAGEAVPFSKEDVILNEGDIMFVRSRGNESFYTGGLLPPLRVPLPRDEDIDVLEAVALIGGPIINGGVNSNNLSGGIVGGGIGGPNPSLLTVLRKTQTERQVAIRVDLNRALADPRERLVLKDGDFLLLQETPSEAVSRYLTGVFQLNFIGNVFSRADAAATATAVVP